MDQSHPGWDRAREPRGVAFYDRLVDELLEQGIIPYVTLYHWELPQALQDIGGWANRETVDAFVRYADVVSGALGDRVARGLPTTSRGLPRSSVTTSASSPRATPI